MTYCLFLLVAHHQAYQIKQFKFATLVDTFFYWCKNYGWLIDQTRRTYNQWQWIHFYSSVLQLPGRLVQVQGQLLPYATGEADMVGCPRQLHRQRRKPGLRVWQSRGRVRSEHWRHYWGKDQSLFFVGFNLSVRYPPKSVIVWAWFVQEPWSSGYGRRHKLRRSWVLIKALCTGLTFFTYICCKNCNLLFDKAT